jgi:beta-lactamase regulating signal transducer with metallopeptidase domain
MIPLETWLAFVVKGSVVLATAGAAAWALRRSSAAVRHVVWAAALASLAALPLASALLPRVPVTVPAWHASAPSVAARLTRLPARVSERAPRVATRPSPVAAAAAASDAREDDAPRIPVAALVMATWLLGASAWLLRTLGGLAVLRRLRASARPLDTALWRERVWDAASELGMSPVALRASSRISVPVTFGVVHPVVMLPEDADTWDAERARVVLLHELAHVRRRDCLVHLVAQCALAMHWMNPLAWLAAARLRIERERACDDLVLACGTNGPRYAEHLLDIARTASRRPIAAAALAMARPTELEGRLLAVLDRTVRRGVTGSRAMLAAMLVAGTAVSAMAAVTLEQGPASPTPTPQAAPTPTPASRPDPKVTPVVGGVEGGVKGGVPGGVKGGVPGGVQGGQGAQGGATNQRNAPVVAGQERNEKATPVRQDVIQALVAALKDESPDVRQQAMHALMQVQSPALVEPMIAALSDGNADVRQEAAQALGQLSDKRAIPGLSGLLADANADVRQQAVFALGQLGAVEATPALVKALSDNAAEVRQQAAFALGQLEAREAVPALVKALADSDAEVRQQAAFALGQLGDKSAVPALLSGMADKTPDVRQQVAFALGQIGDERAIDVLTKGLKDPNADVRQQSAFALGQVIGHHDDDEKEEKEQ